LHVCTNPFARVGEPADMWVYACLRGCLRFAHACAYAPASPKTLRIYLQKMLGAVWLEHSMSYCHCMYGNYTTLLTHALPFLLPTLNRLVSPRLKPAGGDFPLSATTNRKDPDKRHGPSLRPHRVFPNYLLRCPGTT